MPTDDVKRAAIGAAVDMLDTLPTTTSGARAALAPTYGGSYMTTTGRLTYVRRGTTQHTRGRRGRGWLVEVPSANGQRITLAWAPTFLAATREALQWAARPIGDERAPHERFYRENAGDL
jgi:hypothetical protein